MKPQQVPFVEDLYCSYLSALQQFCTQYLLSYPYCLGNVDDYVQETFVKALKCQNKLRKHPNPYGWLVVTCKNICNTEIRKDSRRRKIIGTPISINNNEIEVPDPQDDILRWLCQMDDRERIKSLTDKLTSQEYEVFQSYFFDHLSMKETAQKCGLTKNSVQGALQRIRQKARHSSTLIIFFIAQFILWFLRTK